MKSVVICGSSRFLDEINQFAAQLKQLGASLVLTPNFNTRRRSFMTTLEERERMESKIYRTQLPTFVFQHLDRIRKTDICFVYNKGGYLGVNTTLEIGFAHGRDMLIYALESEATFDTGGEICRGVLFADILSTPEDLYEKLK